MGDLLQRRTRDRHATGIDDPDSGRRDPPAGGGQGHGPFADMHPAPGDEMPQHQLTDCPRRKIAPTAAADGFGEDIPLELGDHQIITLWRNIHAPHGNRTAARFPQDSSIRPLSEPDRPVLRPGRLSPFAGRSIQGAAFQSGPWSAGASSSSGHRPAGSGLRAPFLATGAAGRTTGGGAVHIPPSAPDLSDPEDSPTSTLQPQRKTWATYRGITLPAPGLSPVVATSATASQQSLWVYAGRDRRTLRDSARPARLSSGRLTARAFSGCRPRTWGRRTEWTAGCPR